MLEISVKCAQIVKGAIWRVNTKRRTRASPKERKLIGPDKLHAMR